MRMCIYGKDPNRNYCNILTGEVCLNTEKMNFLDLFAIRKGAIKSMIEKKYDKTDFLIPSLNTKTTTIKNI